MDDIREASEIINAEKYDQGFSVKALADRIARIRAEARAEALKEAVQDFEHYWKIVFGWAKDDGKAIQRLSIHQMRTLCERLVSITEHAILADEPKEERGAEGPEHD